VPKIDPALRSLVEMLAQLAGLTRIPEPMLLQLCEAAPSLAMAQRLPGAEWEAEPANVFRFRMDCRRARAAWALDRHDRFLAVRRQVDVEELTINASRA
jgi:hypothetical protein